MSHLFIDQLEKINTITDKYSDIIATEVNEIKHILSISEPSQLHKDLENILNSERLLNIGIVGRVKAGKSSLLNAVFFNGNNVLPKAATPMTASLTMLTWGENYNAKVEYFSKEDILAIKKDYDQYEELFDKLYHEKLGVLETDKQSARLTSEDKEAKARKHASRKLRESKYEAPHDQYTKILQSGKLDEVSKLTIKNNLTAKTQEELIDTLQHFVGAKGTFMPFTKSVILELPKKELENIQVIDTPGLNDPVISRSQRTKEYLDQCDVVFIISPAGQFVSADDLGLMDQLSSKDGVRELFFVASQADSQLFGNEGEETNWDLDKTITNIRKTLATHANGVIQNLYEEHSETQGQFDQLYKESQDRVLITSSMCHSIKLRYQEQDSWDGDMHHLYTKLQEHFPDYFDNKETALANLEKLSGIQIVKEKILLARQQKNSIMELKQKNWLQGQEEKTTQYVDAIKKNIQNKIKILETIDLQSIQKQKERLEIFKKNGIEAIDGTFEDSLVQFRIGLRSTLNSMQQKLFSTTESQVAHAEESFSETYTWTTGWWFWKKNRSKTITHTTVRTGAIKSSLSSFIRNFEYSLYNEVESARLEWKSSVQKQISKAIKDTLPEENTIDFGMLKIALRRQINSMELPHINFNSIHYENYADSSDSKNYRKMAQVAKDICNAQGTLEDKDANHFMDIVQTYLREVDSYFQSTSKEFLQELDSSARKTKMSDFLFSDMNAQLETIEKDLQNKEAVLHRLNKCLQEIVEI